jgi:cytochrome b561
MTYSRAQILLHWLIFLLITAQYLFHEPIAEAWDKIEDGMAFDFHPLIAAHVFGGLLILCLVIWRIVLRVRLGAPELPAKEPAPLKLAAHVTHLGLYALMFLMPVSGVLAWFGEIEAAAEAHEVMRALLLLLVGLHVIGFLYHQFVLKTDIMSRMKPRG